MHSSIYYSNCFVLNLCGCRLEKDAIVFMHALTVKTSLTNLFYGMTGSQKSASCAQHDPTPNLGSKDL